MILVGLVLLLTGFILNAQVLRRSRDAGLTSAEAIRSLPWMVAMSLVAVGVLVLVLARG